MSGLEAGSTLGGYRILARIRAGAMGALFLARRSGPAGFQRPVAIKVIHDHLAQNKRFLRMFIAEAKLSARIDDPHVVRVEEFGEEGGRYFLVMEYVHGVSLAQALGVLRKRGGLPIDVSVAIAMDVATGLHAAHEATDEDGTPLHIVHRDVSPHNVLVSYQGHVRVIDFGIAKAKQSAGQTMTGSIRGKLAYMAPEQARSAKHVDRRADLYALGLILWEMLVGRRMFTGKNDIALLNQIRNPVIVRPSSLNPRVPKALDDVVMKLLDQDPQNRPPTGANVARLLAGACPTATKVLASDIATAMKAVRDAATEAPPVAPIDPTLQSDPVTASGAGEDDEPEDDDALYGEQVKKGITLFDKGMQEGGEGSDAGVAPVPTSRDATAVGIGPIDDDPNDPPSHISDKTAIMRQPKRPHLTVRTPQAGPPQAPHTIKQTMRIDGQPASATLQSGAVAVTASPQSMLGAPATVPTPPPSVPSSGPYDIVDGLADGPGEITKNRKLEIPQDRSSAVPLLNVENPFVTPEAPKPAPAPTKLPPWLSAPVLLLLTVVFGALLFVFFGTNVGRTLGGSKAPLTTTTPGNSAHTPLENAREAAAEGNSPAVRAYLEKTVKGGKAQTEEVRLVMEACTHMGDTKCVDEVAKKYPAVPRPSPMMP